MILSSLLCQCISVAYGVWLLEWIDVFQWAEVTIMHDSLMLWELNSVIWHYQGKLSKVLGILVIGEVLEIPDEHREAQSMSFYWSVLFIVYWHVAEIDILSC